MECIPELDSTLTEIDVLWSSNYDKALKEAKKINDQITLLEQFESAIKTNALIECMTDDLGYTKKFSTESELYCLAFGGDDGNLNRFTSTLNKVLKTEAEVTMPIHYIDLNGKEIDELRTPLFKNYGFTVTPYFVEAENQPDQKHIELKKVERKYVIKTISPLFFVATIRNWSAIKDVYESSNKIYKVLSSYLNHLETAEGYIESIEKSIFMYCIEKQLGVLSAIQIANIMHNFDEEYSEKISATKRDCRLRYLSAYLCQASMHFVDGREKIIDEFYNLFVQHNDLSEIVKISHIINNLFLEFRKEASIALEKIFAGNESTLPSLLFDEYLRELNLEHHCYSKNKLFLNDWEKLFYNKYKKYFGVGNTVLPMKFPYNIENLDFKI